MASLCKRRPLCFIAVCMFVVMYILVRTGCYEYGRPIYNEGGENIFTRSEVLAGDIIMADGTVSHITKKKGVDGEHSVITLKKCTYLGELLTDQTQTILADISVSEQIKMGERIRLKGKLDYFEHATNPGEFDMYEFYKNRGVLFRISDAEVVAKGRRYSVIAQWLYELKVSNEEYLVRELGEEDAAIMKAMIFGDKNEIDPDIKDSFAKNGIAHILAISGLHISFLGMAVYKLLKRIGVSVRGCAVSSGILIALYGIMVGFSASAFRAICMFALFLVSKCLRRSYDMLSAASVAAIVTMLMNPMIIMDSGCRLSYLAIIGVGGLYACFESGVCKLPRFSDSFVLSLYVFLITLPVIVSSYYEVAFYSVILNLVIIPLMSILLIATISLLILASLRSVVIGCGWDYVVQAISVVMWLPTRVAKLIFMIYKTTCAYLEHLGVWRRNIGTPEVWRCVVFYILIVLSVITPARIVCGTSDDSDTMVKVKRLGVCIAMIASAVIILCIRPCSGMMMTMLDVGQGDGMVIRNDNGHTYLIDGGSSSKRNVGRYRIIPYLKYMGVNQIDGIILTHPDVDHINGIEEVLELCVEENLEPKRIFIYEGFGDDEGFESIRELGAKCGADIIYVRAGECLCDGRLQLEVLYPYGGVGTYDSNNASIVMKVVYGDFSAITTGDVEYEGEEWISENCDIENADILKVAHHGSSSSSSAAFLEKVRPKVALISAGKDNRYGHPHIETLERLDGVRAKVYRTDYCGAITVRIDRRGHMKISGTVPRQ